jgi:hypothetical protein
MAHSQIYAQVIEPGIHLISVGDTQRDFRIRSTRLAGIGYNSQNHPRTD